MAERVVVVGAGISGLSAAHALAESGASVALVERLPALGGVWGFDHPAVLAAGAACRRAGVDLVLGASAIRWSGGRLLVVGPGRVERLDADRLVFAGGTRPPTTAELGIAGGRLAGVFASTVAHHLLDAGVVLGRRTVVVGGADDAWLVVPHLVHEGARVAVVGGAAPTGRDRHVVGAVDWWPGYRVLSIGGADRIDRVLVGAGEASVELFCDSLIIAGDAVPLRNVDGAVRDASPNVLFVQPLDPTAGAGAVAAFARRAVEAAPVPERSGVPVA